MIGDWINNLLEPKYSPYENGDCYKGSIDNEG